MPPYYYSILLLLWCSSCSPNSTNTNQSFYQEKELSFLHLRFGYDPSNAWIKQPQNIKMLHETFKQVGYHKLMNAEEWRNDFNWFLNVNKSPQTLVDSLLLTYSNPLLAPTYYKEFWQRRGTENNASTVYAVLQELQQIMNKNNSVAVEPTLVNDTLARLLSFEFDQPNPSTLDYNSFLDYLIEIGLHYSAYNVFSGECSQFDGVKWQRKEEEVLNQLEQVNWVQRAWLEDDTP